MVSNMFFFWKKQQYQTTTIFLIAARVKCTASRACGFNYGVLWVFRNRWKTTLPKQGAVSAACLAAEMPPPGSIACRSALGCLRVFVAGWTFAFSNRRYSRLEGKFLWRRSATGIFVVGGGILRSGEKHIFFVSVCLYTVLGCTLYHV